MVMYYINGLKPLFSLSLQFLSHLSILQYVGFKLESQASGIHMQVSCVKMSTLVSLESEPVLNPCRSSLRSLLGV